MKKPVPSVTPKCVHSFLWSPTVRLGVHCSFCRCPQENPLIHRTKHAPRSEAICQWYSHLRQLQFPFLCLTFFFHPVRLSQGGWGRAGAGDASKPVPNSSGTRSCKKPSRLRTAQATQLTATQGTTANVCFNIQHFCKAIPPKTTTTTNKQTTTSVRTAVDWNHLNSATIHADFVDSFRLFTADSKGR